LRVENLRVENDSASLLDWVAMKRYFLSMASLSMATLAVILAATALCAPAGATEAPVITKAPPTSMPDPGQFWAEMEYLAWSVSGDKLPALVTTSPVST
jgi:ABC-type sugar transport system substrate-binding protein